MNLAPAPSTLAPVSPGSPEPVLVDVTGMTCAACAARIEKVLGRVPGVEKATVNLALETAEIAAPGVDTELLVAAIERAGFGAHLRDTAVAARRAALERASAERVAEEKRTFLVFAVSAALISFSNRSKAPASARKYFSIKYRSGISVGLQPLVKMVFRSYLIPSHQFTNTPAA